MALNYSGIGFSFVAEDKGVLAAQTRILDGLQNIDRATKGLGTVSAKANKIGINSLNTSFGSLSDQIQTTNDHAAELGHSLGRGLRGSAKKGLGAVTAGFKSVGKLVSGTLKGLAGGAEKVLGVFAKVSVGASTALAMGAEALGHVENGMQTVTQMTSGGQLTTGMEANFVSLAKDARSMGANMGLLGKDLARFTGKTSGMADSLNIDVNKAGEAIAAFTKASKEFGLVGLKSASDIAKFSVVTGMDIGDLKTVLKQARGEFGLSEEQTKRLVGSFQAFGTQAGDIGGALKELPSVMDTMRKRAAQMGKSLEGADLEKFAAQTASLASGLFATTKDSKKAMEVARGVAEGMVASREGFGRMFAGLEQDLPDFNKNIAIAFGNVDFSFDQMRKGPAEFITEMAKMVKQAKKSGHLTSESFDFMAKYVTEAVGKDMAPEIISFFRNANEATLDMMASTEKFPADLGKVAKAGFSTGRTLQDNFERSKDFFIMGFRNIGRSAAVDFVGETSKQFKIFNKQLQDLAGRGGAMGAVVEKFSEMHQIGAQALLPKTLRPMASVFGTFMSELAPSVSILRQFGFNLSSLVSPSGLVISALAGIAGWFGSLVLSGKSAGEALGSMGESIGNFFISLPDKIATAISFVNDFFISVSGNLVEGAKNIKWKRIWDKVVDGASRAFKMVVGAVKELATGFWETLAHGVDPDAGGRSGIAIMGGYLASFAKRAWEFAKHIAVDVVWPAIKDFGSGLFDGFAKVIDPAKSDSWSYQVGGALSKAISYAIDVVVSALPAVWDSISRFAGALWDGFEGNISDPSTVTGTAERVGATVGKFLGEAFDVGVTKFENLIRDNPKAAALITFAAGGGGFGGGIAALGVFVTGSGVKAMGMVTENQFDYLLQEMEKGIQAAGFKAGTTFDEAAKDGIAKALASTEDKSKFFGKHWIDQWWDAGKAENSIKGALKREAQFVLDATNDIDKHWREHGFQQLTAYTTHLDQVVSAWSSSFGVTNQQAFDQVMTSLQKGTLVSDLESVKQKGFLKDLQIQFKYTSQEQAVAIQKMAQGWGEFKQKVEEKAAGIKTSASNMVDSIKAKASKFGSLFGFGSGSKPPTAKATVSTEQTFIQKSKVDQKTLQGDVDTIRKATLSVAKNMDAPLKKAVEMVLEDAFEKAYKSINEGTLKFAKLQVETLSKMASDIKTQLVGMWVDVLKATATSVKAIQSDVLATIPAMKAVQAMAHADTSAATLADLPKEASREDMLKTGNDLLVQAIDWPAWYTEEFRNWAFEQKQATVAMSAAVIAGAGPGQKEALQTPTASDNLAKMMKPDRNKNSPNR